MEGGFLEISTFVLLVVVVLTKYGTTKHLVVLQQKKVELENVCNRHEQRHKGYVKEREQFEAELKSVQREVSIQQSGLEKLLAQLEEQVNRNQELEDRAS
jgi:uncharacterized protein YlxW (UPF0749 family)